MKKFVLFLIFMFLGLSYVHAEKVDVTLNACVDGDTAWFNLDGTKTKFRFLGIDTPESVHPKKDVELYGKDASEYTCNLLSNANKIQVEYDGNSDKTDKYDRHLAWIWVDDVLLQQSLISIGYAQVAYIYGNYNHLADLCLEQEYAMTNKSGIWNGDREIGYCGTIDYSEGNLLNKNIHKVIFKDNESEEMNLVVDGSLVSEPSVEVKTGYIFKGWYLNGKLFDFNNPITETIVLEAHYSIDYKYLGLVFGVLLVSVFFKKNKKGRK